MPDLASQIEDRFFEDDALEPDENTLITALRNQDDIPILMDVVKDQVSAELADDEEAAYFSISNEEISEGHVEEALSNSDELNASESDVSQTSASPEMISHELISQAIAQVLEKRLPELVKEVIDVVADLSSVKN